MTNLDWYVVQTHPFKEAFVRERIEDLGREVFLPMMKEKLTGGRRWQLAPLFPGYLFARLSEKEGDFPRVRWAPGVTRVLGDGPQPRRLDGTVVECIRKRTDRTGRLKLGRALKTGARVRIVDGPLSGLIGILERPVYSREQRVAVLLEVFHRVTRVELPVHAVWGEASP